MSQVSDHNIERREKPRFDSRPDTWAHISTVRRLVEGVARDLMDRADRHDRSKLESPEVETFDRVSPMLAQLEFGTPEYRAALEQMGPALRHHYEYNDHHPEHFEEGGVNDMNLMQLTEMLCDWIAASRRMKGWTPENAWDRIQDSISKNAIRFSIPADIEALLRRTVEAILDGELGGGCALADGIAKSS